MNASNADAVEVAKPDTFVLHPKMLPNRVKYLLTFFDAFGYNSGSSKLSSCRLSTNLINFSHFLLATFLTWFTVYWNAQLPFAQFIELLNHSLSYLSSICMYWLTIWDSFHHWREHHRFWAIFLEINESFQPQHNFTCRPFIFKLFSVISTTFITVLIHFIVADSLETSRVIVTYTILVKLCQLRVFYFVFCLEVINFQLKSIEIVLKQMNEPINVQSNGSGTTKRFKWIQGYYYSVCEMATIMNDIFDWSQIAAVIFCFTTFITNLNWICVHFHEIPPLHFAGKYTDQYQIQGVERYFGS